MKLIILVIILLSLYLIYRLSFPRQAGRPKENETPPSKPPDNYESVVKNRFVLPEWSNPAQHDDRKQDSDKQAENALIFAAGNEKPDAVIPHGKLDEVFDEEPDPEELDIDPDDEEETGSPDSDGEEEDEELRQTLGRDAEPAGGFSVEEMEEAAKAVDKPSDEKAAILFRVEKTDLFEKLVSGDEGKAARITALIERHLRSLNPEIENEESDNNSDLENFDMMEFLS
jgi:hypothetical protein